MKAFQRFLDKWIARHCTDPDGKEWSQRAVAERLGVSQNEVSSWRSGKSRPGLPRVIALRNHTGVDFDEMLGLPPLRSKKAS